MRPVLAAIVERTPHWTKDLHQFRHPIGGAKICGIPLDDQGKVRTLVYQAIVD